MNSNQQDCKLDRDFNHQYSPDELVQLNGQLAQALVADPFDETSLHKIIEQRANLVESLLNNLDEQQKRCFATCERDTNDAILTLVEQRRANVKKALAKVSKASKAIKQYHQV